MTMEKIAQELPNHGEVSDGDSWETMKNRSGSGKKTCVVLIRIYKHGGCSLFFTNIYLISILISILYLS